MVKPYLSVIVPAYNHERHILMTLLDIYRHLESQPYASEILVVDDHSTDNTADMITRCLPLMPNLKLLQNQSHQGEDFTLKQGMLLAGGDWRVIMPAKGEVAVIEFNKVIPHAQSGHEVFLSPDNDFQCFSAKAAEKVFSQRRRYTPARARRFGYKVKKVFLKNRPPIGPLASLKRLWQNLMNH